MPDIDLATLEKLNFALEIMGFSIVGFVLAKINSVLKSKPAVKGLELIDTGFSVADDIRDRAATARAFVTEYLEDGLDEQELKAALHRIEKVEFKKLAEVAD